VESNVVGTLNLLNQSVQSGVKKIVFGSSGGTVYGVPQSIPIPENHPTNPICSYGITKLTIEKYLALFGRLHGLEPVILRMANPYGERQDFRRAQGAVAVFLGKTYRDETIEIWGDGTVARDFFYIGDLLPAVAAVIEEKVSSTVYNIGSGECCSLNAVLEAIRKVTGKEPKVEYKPGRPLDVPINCLDISRAKSELGWAPTTPLEEGLKKTWDWLRTETSNHRAMSD
jgi:UDP-glucose 4-epimerase